MLSFLVKNQENLLLAFIGIVTLMNSLLNHRNHLKEKAAIQEYHLEVNGRLTAMMALISEADVAKGRLLEQQEAQEKITQPSTQEGKVER